MSYYRERNFVFPNVSFRKRGLCFNCKVQTKKLKFNCNIKSSLKVMSGDTTVGEKINIPSTNGKCKFKITRTLWEENHIDDAKYTFYRNQNSIDFIMLVKNDIYEYNESLILPTVLKRYATEQDQITLTPINVCYVKRDNEFKFYLQISNCNSDENYKNGKTINIRYVIHSLSHPEQYNDVINEVIELYTSLITDKSNSYQAEVLFLLNQLK